MLCTSLCSLLSTFHLFIHPFIHSYIIHVFTHSTFSKHLYFWLLLYGRYELNPGNISLFIMNEQGKIPGSMIFTI